MTTLRHLLYFSLRLLREMILYIAFILELMGILITYFTSFKVPVLGLWLFPIIAIYLAAFNIYRKGAADIRIVFLDPKEAEFICSGGHEDICQEFSTALYGHFVNFGPQSGVIENIDSRFGLNGLYDAFVIRRLRIGIHLSPLIAGKASVHQSKERLTDKYKGQIDFPLVLNPGTIQPFTMILKLYINTFNSNEIADFIKWLKEIDVHFRYMARQANGVRNQHSDLIIPAKRKLKKLIEQ